MGVFFGGTMKKLNVRMMMEAGLMMALALILDNIRIFTMPQGGSVTLGSMIPIIFFAFRWGAKSGILVGLMFGVLQVLLGGKMLHPLSLLLDYVIAWGALGVAGLFSGSLTSVMIGTIVGISGRFLCSFLSGVTIWAEYAPEGMNVALYSLIYNGSYMGVEAIISLVVIFILYQSMKGYFVKQGQ